MTTKPLDLAQFEGHTPGPWESTRRDDRHGNWMDTLVGQATNYGGFNIARIEGMQDHNLVDARLITAAPSLLAECKRLIAERAQLVAALRELAADYRDCRLAFTGSEAMTLTQAKANALLRSLGKE